MISFRKSGEVGYMQGARGNSCGRGRDAVAKVEDYNQVRALAYDRQDRILAVLRAEGIDPWDPLTILALTYHVAQGVGRDEAKKLAEAKKVGVM